MKSTRFALAVATLAILVVGLGAGAALAGGRADVTILSAPAGEVEAGKTIEVAFAIKPNWPMAKNRSLEPTVKAVCGDRVVTLAAVPLKKSGEFKAAFVLPAAGEWVITVDSHYCETRMKPLILTAEAAKSVRS